MTDLTKHVKDELSLRGAALVGIGDLTGLPEAVRRGLPTGISVAVKYPKEIISGIAELPTAEYRDWYNTLNDRLDAIVTHAEELLHGQGHRAVAQTRRVVGAAEKECQSLLPHKTVATRAGMGWIGKCALLITEQYGSMVRLSSVLTDAPLDCAAPIDRSRCGDCTACTNACPAGAVSGRPWSVGMRRDEFYDAFACREAARERSLRGFGGNISLCGKCIEVCPYTRRYNKQNGTEMP